MRNLIPMTAALAIGAGGLTATACGDNSSDAASRSSTAAGAQAESGTPVNAASQVAPAQLARVRFHVEGMTCGGCVIGTRVALKRLDGVREADASYEDSSAWALYDPAKVTPERMMAAIGELGYTAKVVES
jgi:copper chaperone